MRSLIFARWLFHLQIHTKYIPVTRSSFDEIKGEEKK